MIDQSLGKEFIAFFERYLSFYKEFLQLEKEKFDIVSTNRVSELDGCVKREEAFMLKSKGMDLERDRLMQKTEKPNATFREIIPLFDESQREAVQTLFDTFSKVLLEFKELNLRCNYLTELRLNRIKIELKKLENRPDLQKLYNEKAKEKGIGPTFLSRKV